MPHYHLNIRNDTELDEDTDGAIYPSPGDARNEAILSARQIMGERIRFGEPLRKSRFEITDADGQVVLVMTFEEALVGIFWLSE
jgi:hypothetical protein